MSLLIAVLYLLAIASLFGSAIFVYAKNPRSRVHQYYALSALSLLGWVVTLFVFDGETSSQGLLWVGRLNFALAVIPTAAGYLFIRELSGRPPDWRTLIWTETWGLAAISLFTGLIDHAELLISGVHITHYGLLFPLYITHIVGFLAASVFAAFRPSLSAPRQARMQMRIIGYGILLASIIGVTSNILLPYLFGNFRYIDVGPIASMLFVAAVGYAVVRVGLFRIHIILRTTLIYAGLVSITLELYQLAVVFLTRLLPLGDVTQRHLAAAAVALIINAFTQEPLKNGLERVIDQIIRRKPTPRTLAYEKAHATAVGRVGRE